MSLLLLLLLLFLLSVAVSINTAHLCLCCQTRWCCWATISQILCVLLKTISATRRWLPICYFSSNIWSVPYFANVVKDIKPLHMSKRKHCVFLVCSVCSITGKCTELSYINGSICLTQSAVTFYGSTAIELDVFNDLIFDLNLLRCSFLHHAVLLASVESSWPRPNHKCLEISYLSW